MVTGEQTAQAGFQELVTWFQFSKSKSQGNVLEGVAPRELFGVWHDFAQPFHALWADAQQRETKRLFRLAMEKKERRASKQTRPLASSGKTSAMKHRFGYRTDDSQEKKSK